MNIKLYFGISKEELDTILIGLSLIKNGGGDKLGHKLATMYEEMTSDDQDLDRDWGDGHPMDFGDS